MFEKLDTICKYPGCGINKNNHTYDLWEQHKQLNNLRGGNSIGIRGVALGMFVMAWVLIMYHGIMTWVIK